MTPRSCVLFAFGVLKNHNYMVKLTQLAVFDSSCGWLKHYSLFFLVPLNTEINLAKKMVYGQLFKTVEMGNIAYNLSGKMNCSG